MLFGAAAVAVAAPILKRVPRLYDWLAGLRSENHVTVAQRMEPSALANAFAQVERWDLPVKHVYMHPDDFENLLEAQGSRYPITDEVDGETRVWGATVHTTPEVERHRAWVMYSREDPRGVAEIHVRPTVGFTRRLA